MSAPGYSHMIDCGGGGWSFSSQGANRPHTTGRVQALDRAVCTHSFFDNVKTILGN